MARPDLITRDALAKAVGTELGCSDWVTVTQARIDAFAEITEDRQYIHVDPVRAAQTKFAGTVAHGFLTLSMLSSLAYDALPPIEGQTASVNYGFDKIRFIAPVRSGAKIRARFALQEIEARGATSLVFCLAVTVEIDGGDKPALTALWRILYFFEVTPGLSG